MQIKILRNFHSSSTVYDLQSIVYSLMTGLYHEPFTQKYHALFRDYDPQHQRWLSEDPEGYVDGMNLYHAYMNVNYIDPKGNFIQFAVLAYLGWVALNTAIDVSLDSLAETYLGDGVMSGEDLAWSAGTNFAINFISFGIGGKLAKAKYLRYLKREKKGVKESKRAVKGRRAAVIGSTIVADATMTSMVQGSIGLMRGQDANFTQSFGWGLFGGTVGRSIGLGFSRLMKFRGGQTQGVQNSRKLYTHYYDKWQGDEFKSGTAGRAWVTKHTGDWVSNKGLVNWVKRLYFTGRGKPFSGTMEIPIHAMHNFKPISPFGVVRLWKSFVGQGHSTRPGNINLLTGKMTDPTPSHIFDFKFGNVRRVFDGIGLGIFVGAGSYYLYDYIEDK